MGDYPDCARVELVCRERRVTKYKVVVQYLATGYAGWQVQPDRPTIGGTIESTLNQLTGESPAVVGSGRTDAGVHALGQVAHFRLQKAWSSKRLLRALNGILPAEIRVLRLLVAPPSFHAQKDALKKRYIYRVYNGPVLSPFLHKRVYQVRGPALELESIQQAAKAMLGRHDFSGFAASTTRVKNRTRTVLLSRWRRTGRLFEYQIESEGFLHHMVRNIVGTLVQIGLGKRQPEEMRQILESRDRRLAGPTAPPQGLYLARVWYPK